jgi:hypothetical protein
MLKEIVKTEDLDRGYSGTASTIAKMHKLVALGKLDPTMHRIATWIRLQVPQDRRGATRETAEAIFDYVKRHGIFQRDQFQIERIEHPLAAMQPVIEARKAGAYKGPGLFVGDCDQFATQVATLGGILGFQYAFETAKTDMGRPDEFSHVWSALLVGKDWLPLDASTPSATPGWRPPVPSDKFKRWPEELIEETMKGMGDGEEPMDYFSNTYDDQLTSGPIDVAETDPGRLDLLIPEQPAIPEAEMTPGVENIRKVPAMDPADRASMMSSDPLQPSYAQRQNAYYRINSKPYPQQSLYNRGVRIDMSKRPGKRAYYSAQAAPPTFRDVDIVGGETFTVNREGGMKTIVRRPHGSDMVIMRPKRISAGMSDGEIITSYDQIMTSAPTSSYPSGPNLAPGQTAPAVAPTAPAATTSIFDTITKAITSLVPPVLQAAVTNKYASAVANATNKVTGAQVVTPAQLSAPTTWYKNPWILGGGAVLLAAGGFAIMKSSGGVRRRRR